MAADLNCVVLMGRFGSDPELKQTTNGLSVTSFRLAVNKQTKAGEHPEASWINCVAWKGTAEFITNYFKKGSRIIIEGRLDTRTYKNKDGKDQSITEVIISSAHFVDKKQETTSAAPSNNTYESDPELDAGDSELPFN